MTSLDIISHPVATIAGEISVPGDKSISHRSVIFGSIARGITEVHGFLDGEDCLATIKAFRSMGVTIEGPHQKKLIIHGVGKHGLKAPNAIIDCGNSGTSMRLLAGLLSAQPFDSILTGDGSLLKRPMGRIIKPLSAMGAGIESHDGLPPLKICGQSQLTGINYQMPVASAQVKSCLILAGMYADGITRITETGISRDHTERMLEAFSYPLEREGNTLVLNSQAECKAARIDVPGDISSAAFFIVAATIIPGAHIVIKNVGFNPTRTGIISILRAMGASIQESNTRFVGDEPIVDLEIKHAKLQGISIDEALVPLAIDEFPAIFIAAASASGTTILRGAHELRVKESDRIGAMVEGLNQLGIAAEALDDGAIIPGGTFSGGRIKSRGDHRIAMAFSIAGAVANAPVCIEDCANITTSFPGFIQTANALKLMLEEH